MISFAPLARQMRSEPTAAENHLWQRIRRKQIGEYKFRRQHPLGPHILDFFCMEAELDIELDGSQHGHPEQASADAERDRWHEDRGIKVLRFWNGRLRREKQAVRDAIWQAL